ncbi:MAG: CRTAC1 family protein [Verrucomicrobia bacterium]|nr:CRTAC1 family protein [Verrucomicrobiota bacterium]
MSGILFTRTACQCLRRRVTVPMPLAFVFQFERFVRTIVIGAVTLALVARAGCQEPDEATKALLTQRRQLDETVFAMEKKAQEYEESLVYLWDSLLSVDRTNKGDTFEIFAKIPLESILLGTVVDTAELDHGIQAITLGPGDGIALDTRGWKDWLLKMKQSDLHLVQSEWHHQKFEIDEDGIARSEVSLVLHVAHRTSPLRFVVEGVAKVAWSEQREADGRPRPSTIDASGLKILRREGQPAFKKWFTFDPSERSGKPTGIHPLLLYDLNGDGLSEVVAAGCNAVFSQDGKGGFVGNVFLDHWQRAHEAGVIADLDGDAIPDFATPSMNGDMLLYVGAADGSFPHKPKGGTEAGGPLKQPTALAAGDIDLDGDVDLWVGQYRVSYFMGMMPAPYYDANDGFPAYLLVNEGAGKFSPRTLEAGLDKKRNRRTYTAAFVDLDDDHDLDLLVVSDFAGVDAYENDGTGKFKDITGTLVDERHLFGMSATFADYNLDGQLDFFVAGMGSTTARRLESMNAGRDDARDVQEMRMKMGYGNRMYLRVGKQRYEQPPFKDQVARTGWTWGTTSLDFDNDGDKDIFVANGHSSGASTKDHCTHFWCHDIYKPETKPNKAMHNVFQLVHQGYFDKTESWDGYQKSHLLMNVGGTGFRNVAFLMGVADEFDGRAALSDDLDGDGRMDLLIVEDRWSKGQVLHVYRNTMETGNAWIGVRVADSKEYGSPLGAQVSVTTAGGRQVAAIIAGETLHGQHAPMVHFGLGKNQNVQSIDVVWPGGRRAKLEAPEVNRYHRFPPF